MQNKRFIVTGGAGLIGSNLVKALNHRGCRNIIIVDNLNHPAKQKNLNRLEFSDYLDRSDFRKLLHNSNTFNGIACVFHLGACSSTMQMDESYLHYNNFLYTRELCEEAMAAGVRFIYASSAATYGNGSHGYSDSDAITPLLRPLNPYGNSKQQFDLLALEQGWLNKIAGIKYFNVYGPGEDHKGPMRSLVHKAYNQIRKEGKITLFRSHRPEYADGMQQRDFVYVADAVAVTLFFYDHPEVSGLFNCGTANARTWLDLARGLFAAMDVPEKIEFIDIPENIRDKYQYHTMAEMEKLRAVGYNAKFTSIEDGIKNYVMRYLNPKEEITA